MRWASALCEHNDLEQAITPAVETLQQQMEGARADLLLVFASGHYHTRLNQLSAHIGQHFPHAVVFGCSGGGVIGAGREIEQTPALSITAAHLPEVDLTPFQLEMDRLPAKSDSNQRWYKTIGLKSTEQTQFLILADPYTFDPQPLLLGLDRAYPGAIKIGGLASGIREHPHALFLNNAVFRSGAIGVALSGNISVDAIVAQGCRPIGEPLFITASEGQRIISLDGQTPLAVLQNLYQSLNSHDQGLLRHSLFIGIAMRDDHQTYRQGDFLIRNILGLDQDSGVLSIGAQPGTHQVVQFHLRDADASAADLESLLKRYCAGPPDPAPCGAVLFSCLGRGEHLYGIPNHDSQAFAQHLGPLPLGGFFCNGEIGPVQGTTYLHGYTSAFGVFRPLA